ncbi:hypothetical protein TRVA0_033S01618 [Trichomonascus vanleenenianus]|uniref:uncharacterized protein n=1 Tax=Trichomonascus vanleenenianus TaxID=2268995 RepID=UPI003ECA7984
MAECYVRLAAYGITTLILVQFFTALEVPEELIGVFMTLTLFGDVVLSYVVTHYADRIGRRRVLLYAAAAMALSGVIFATSDNYWLLLFAAVIGVISPSGDECGPFKSIEESTLAHLTTYDERSDIFAWFEMIGTLGQATGALGGGMLIAYYQANFDRLTSYRMVFWTYTALALVKVVLNLFLSPQCEAEEHHQLQGESGETTGLLGGDAEERGTIHKLSRETKKLVVTLCILFGCDSFGGGFINTSWVVAFFHRKFAIPEAALGTMWFFATLIGSCTALLSSSICKRIGPIWAMAATHFPAAVFNATMPLPSALPLAMALFLGRGATTTMDVVPRQVFLASMVRANERTRVMGIVNVVKTLGRSIGPTFTGAFAARGLLWVCFLIAGTLESVHDIGLVLLFGRGHRPKVLS